MNARRVRRLLVVEDEEHLAAGLKLNFSLEGFEVDIARSAREAGQHLVRPHAYAAILLDIMLPDLDGFRFCEQLRNAGNFTPVIMLTARSAPEDRVRGLEAGADDYQVKPFELPELLARVRSLLRRRSWEFADAPDPRPSTAHLAFGRIQVNFDTHQVLVGGESLKLTRLELDLLRYFADHPGRVIGREELLEKVWRLRDYPNTRTVDNYVLRLRKHFEPDPSAPVYFLSVRGSGYRFCPVPAA